VSEASRVQAEPCKINPKSLVTIALIAKWRHSGFNVHCGPRILPRPTEAAENLACCIIRTSVSQERLRYDAPSATGVYNGKDGSWQKTFERSFGPMCRGLPENWQKRV
jgi:hypothetical protein